MLERLTRWLAGLRRKEVPQNLVPADHRGWFRVLESFPGAWQRNVELSRETILTHSTVFACLTLIASDIGKLWLNLVSVDENGISTPTTSPAFSSVLDEPNHYQHRMQFLESWVLSKLIYGNAYILKGRDNRRVVNELHVLDANRVRPLVSPSGEVFYQLGVDYLSGLTTQTDLILPASEIIHDRMNCFFHQLVGLSPLSACWLAASQGLNIQQHSATFFGNRAMPGGVILVPGAISDDNAAKLRQNFNENYTGVLNAGRVMVLGDGMKFEGVPVTNAVDAQLIESLKLSAETIPPVFHVPLFKVGLGPMPSYNNIQAVNLQYATDALQTHLEAIEIGLAKGLDLPSSYAIEFDETALYRMDTLTAVEAATKGITGGLYTPNEGRQKNNLKPVEGGDSPMLQQQQYSLAALARRDSQQPPPPTPPLTPAPAPEPAAMKEADGIELFFKELTDLDAMAA